MPDPLISMLPMWARSLLDVIESAADILDAPEIYDALRAWPDSKLWSTQIRIALHKLGKIIEPLEGQAERSDFD